MDVVYAMGQAGKSGGLMGNLISLAPILIIIVIFYLFLILPQQRKAKALRAKLSSIQVGDKVLTNSGIIASVHKIISAEYLELEIADKVFVTMRRNAVVDLNPSLNADPINPTKK